MKKDVLKVMEKEGIECEQLIRDKLLREREEAGEDIDNFVFVGDSTTQLLYRRNSFKRLLNNDSLKYFENGQQDVFDEFQKYSI